MRRIILSFGLLLGCGGGQYGYTREYVALDDEVAHMERATPVTYEDVKRDPRAYGETTVGWFGVVTSVAAGPDGQTLVAMTFRTHQDRHLCADETEGSCRVTVSDRTSGPWSALVRLHEEDRAGDARVWTGSLLKVYGRANGEFDDQGGPILVAEWYRHWPRGAYVTTGAAGSMRR